MSTFFITVAVLAVLFHFRNEISSFFGGFLIFSNVMTNLTKDDQGDSESPIR